MGDSIMSACYLVLNTEQAVWLNQLMMDHYVCQNGQHQFPFTADTSAYLDITQKVFCWDDLIESALDNPDTSVADKAQLAALKLTRKTLFQAFTEAGIPLPAELPSNQED
jgi:hypothetical protein